MLNSLTADVLEALGPASGPFLILTVGNSFRSDDGVGPYIASCLRPVPVKVMDAGNTPENIVDEAIAFAPDKITVIDCADFGGTAGEVRVIPEELIPETTLSTHMVPINVITRLIGSSIKTSIVFIGIQPEAVTLGEGLSPEVRQAADEIIGIIKRNFAHP